MTDAAMTDWSLEAQRARYLEVRRRINSAGAGRVSQDEPRRAVRHEIKPDCNPVERCQPALNARPDLARRVYKRPVLVRRPNTRVCYRSPIGPQLPPAPMPVLRDILRIASTRAVPRKQVVAAVLARHPRVNWVDITSKRVQAPVVRVRHELAWALRTYTGMSYPEIGKFLGGRDHTTAMYAVSKHQKLIDEGRAEP